MKRFLLIFLFGVSGWGLNAQTLTFTSPAGLEEPFEVSAGTQVTVTYKNNSAPTAFFTHTSAPDLSNPYQLDTGWKQNGTFTDNGDGTSNFTLTVTTPVFVWGGTKMDFTGMWLFSNVIGVDILSSVKIAAADGFLCAAPDTELLSVAGSYTSYQWFLNNEPINGATASTYQATEAGQYKVQVPVAGKSVFSNTVRVKTAAVTFTGSLSGKTLTLKAADGLASYQWLSGSTPAALTPIASSTSVTKVITLTGTKTYYAVKAVQAGCTVTSEARPASTVVFQKPVIAVDAPPANGSGKICTGSVITLSIPDQYTSYEWLQDGKTVATSTTSIQLYSESGFYSVMVTNADWPEVGITSDETEVEHSAPKTPALSGVKSKGYCPGENATITLVDVGYEYTWYKHTNYNYTEEDKVTVSGVSYVFPVESDVHVTVVAHYLGCESSTMVDLKSFNDAVLYPELSDYSKTFLCPGSTVDILFPSDVVASYDKFQWYKLSGTTYKPISGKTSANYTVTAPGQYLVKASPAGCTDVEITSESVLIQDNADRSFYIDYDKATACMGEEVTLSVSSEWTNIQWLEKKIVFGEQTPYTETYVPISGAGSGNTLKVSKFTGYQVKARHESCPAGLKSTSTTFELLPTVNPDIKTEPDHAIHRWHKAPYDSIANYLYCADADLTLTLPAGYASYKWYKAPYNGDDNYVQGTLVENVTGSRLSILADGAVWYTAEVELDGCKGISDPILIDTYVHSSPAVESRDNSELCHLGDSTLLNSAFQGNWAKYEWYKDGELVPDSDNDSLYAKEPGGYILKAFPEECPTIGYSSGVPVSVTLYPKATIVENDTVLYALPLQGFYEFQWYYNGTAIENEELPWVLHKNKMKSGSYTVEVTNPKACSSTSDEFVWVVTGVEDGLRNELTVYPNPTHDVFTIRGLDAHTVQGVNLYTAQGFLVQQVAGAKSWQFDLSARAPGIYVVEVVLSDGSRKQAKILRY